MSTLSKPASDCRISQLVATYHQREFRRPSQYRISRRLAFCSYTNDVARMSKNCQACLEAKKPRCRIKVQLPWYPVYTPGRSLRLGRPACTFVCKRYLRKGLSRCLQRNQRAGTNSMTQPTIRLTVNGSIHNVKAD